MKSVRTADGTSFESKFETAMKKESRHVLRLPTLNTGYAGMSQPSDFIVVGDYFNYVEVKETSSDRFAVSSMQQLKEVLKYEQEKLYSVAKAFLEGHYYLVVHFLSSNTYSVIDSIYIELLVAQHKTLRNTDKNALIFDSLEKLCKELKL